MKQSVWVIWIGSLLAILVGSGWVATAGHVAFWLTLVAHVVEFVAKRSLFERAGGWADPFFYAHEGIELAWRVWDQGRRVWYAGDLVAEHPAVSPTRHSYYYRLNARNRVWLARRNLPAVLVPLYVGSWTGIQLLRWFRKPAVLSAWFGGWREGRRSDPGERRPIRWRTVARMTLAGRPPIV